MVEHALDSKERPSTGKAGGKHRRQFSRHRAPLDRASSQVKAATAAEAGCEGHERHASETPSLRSSGMFSALVAVPSEPALRGQGEETGAKIEQTGNKSISLPQSGEASQTSPAGGNRVINFSSGPERHVSETPSVGSPGMFSALVTVPPALALRGRGEETGAIIGQIDNKPFSMPQSGGASKTSPAGGNHVINRSSSSNVANDGDCAGGGGGQGNEGPLRLLGKNEDNRLIVPSPNDGGGSGASSSILLIAGAASTEAFSTLSPLGSESSMGSSGECGADGGGVASPGTLKQLESVKAQLTDLLRALAVSFGQVGYCQGK